MPDIRAVRVRYTVERTVYVYADTDAEGRRKAKDTTEWIEEDDPIMQDDIRVVRS